MARSGILYLSYDGMLEPLGQSQVLAYLEPLAAEHRIHLVSFEKRSDWQQRERRRAMIERIARAGISWTPLRYHKRPSLPATLFDVAQGTGVALLLVRRHRLQIVHARSLIAGLIAVTVKRLTGARFLYDMRGFWADERVDGGLWPAGGRLHRGARRIEVGLLRAADAIVTLTQASLAPLRRPDRLGDRPTPIRVIPTCADLERFRPDPSRPERPLQIGYVGSIGTWYLFDESLALFRCIRAQEPDAQLLVITRSPAAQVLAAVAKAGIDPVAVRVMAADHAAMPGLVQSLHLGLSLILPAPSKIASAPTKLAEYLGCGVPCVGNRGVGDVAALLEERRVGIALDGFDEAALRSAAASAVQLAREPGIAELCRYAAIDCFSLTSGVGAYRDLYRLLSRSAPPHL